MRTLLVMGTSAGGMGRHVHGLAEGLLARGHDVMIGCPADADEHFGYSQLGARVKHLPISDRPNPANDMRSHSTLRALIEGADVIHAHGLRAGAVCALARTGHDTPLVVTLHNATPDGSWIAGVYNALDRLVASKADVVLGVSKDLEERQRELGARQVGHAVIPAPPVGAAHRDAATVRRELGVDDGTTLVVTIARLSPQKGLPVLFNAANRLQGKDIRFVVAGDGPLRADLQADIDARRLPVTLLGDRRDVPDLLAAADIVVSAANWEGQPLGLQEALQSGCAIVATDAGGTAAVVGSGGILVPVGDDAKIADAIAKVADNATYREELRSRARARAEALPTQDAAVEAAIAQYDAVLAAR